jgi:sec-independent protein translocase protein TatB
MFDIGGWEFLIIVIVAIVVVGPRELPGLVRTVSGWIRQARGLAQEFRSGLDDLAHEVELEKIGDDVSRSIGLKDEVGTIRNEIEQSIDPHGEISDAFTEDRHLLEDYPLDSDEEFDLDDDSEFDYPDGETDILPEIDSSSDSSPKEAAESGKSGPEQTARQKPAEVKET